VKHEASHEAKHEAKFAPEGFAHHKAPSEHHHEPKTFRHGDV